MAIEHHFYIRQGKSLPNPFNSSKFRWPGAAYSGNIGYVTAYNRGTTSAQPLHMISSETVLGGVANAPASPTAAGTQGQIAWDTSYICVCTAANTWRRAALSTW